MRIGIDIDAVCNNLVNKWLDYLNKKHNLNVKYDDITYYYINDFFPTLTNEQLYEPLCDSEFLESLTPQKDSAKYLKQLIDDGHEVKLITATILDNILPKCNWVLKHYPFFIKNDIWVVHNKNWINADILLDDCIDNLEGGTYTGICYSQPWNQNYNGLRVNNWEEFYNLIKDIECVGEEYEFV